MKCLKCKEGNLLPIKKDGVNYAQCDKCGVLFSADDLRTYAAQKTQSSQPQAPEKKKSGCLKTGMIIVGLFLAIFIVVGAITNLSSNKGSSNDGKSTTKTEATEAAEKKPSQMTDDLKNKKNDDNSITSGNYEIDGVDVYFSDSVRNDITGDLRLSKVATSTDIIEYAKKYHDTLFTSDDEIHAVVNFSLNTTSRLSMLSQDLMDISILEYVDKEEHDASTLFSGMLLKEYFLTLSNGQIEELSSASGAVNGTETQTSTETPQDPALTTDSNTSQSNFDTYNNPSQQQTSSDYVLNTNTMKFHFPSCDDVPKIAPENYATFDGARDDVLNQGYSPCGHCNP